MKKWKIESGKLGLRQQVCKSEDRKTVNVMQSCSPQSCSLNTNNFQFSTFHFQIFYLLPYCLMAFEINFQLSTLLFFPPPRNQRFRSSQREDRKFVKLFLHLLGKNAQLLQIFYYVNFC